mmetsp:Transcript_11459/g.36401  ORF Transcript_11459/g.36401 Transcript_11459/m.36401 type:complete len:344 (-) Transcript_11459:2261-3292(-)
MRLHLLRRLSGAQLEALGRVEPRLVRAQRRHLDVRVGLLREATNLEPLGAVGASRPRVRRDGEHQKGMGRDELLQVLEHVDPFRRVPSLPLHVVGVVRRMSPAVRAEYLHERGHALDAPFPPLRQRPIRGLLLPPRQLVEDVPRRVVHLIEIVQEERQPRPLRRLQHEHDHELDEPRASHHERRVRQIALVAEVGVPLVRHEHVVEHRGVLVKLLRQSGEHGAGATDERDVVVAREVAFVHRRASLPAEKVAERAPSIQIGQARREPLVALRRNRRRRRAVVPSGGRWWRALRREQHTERGRRPPRASCGLLRLRTRRVAQAGVRVMHVRHRSGVATVDDPRW